MKSNLTIRPTRFVSCSALTLQKYLRLNLGLVLLRIWTDLSRTLDLVTRSRARLGVPPSSRCILLC
jgi:hypothetical protein